MLQLDRRILIGGIILVVLVALSLLTPILPLGDPAKVAAGPRLSPPSWLFPFGTDQLGRSNLPRVLQAIQSTCILSALAIALTMVVATPLALFAAYRGGLIDQGVMRIADVLFALPPMLMAVLVAAIVGPGWLASVAAIVMISLPLFLRIVRSAALSVARRDFVTVARLSGASPLRVVFVHLLGNIIGPLTVQFAYALSVGMLIESTLSFLGMGMQPPAASLGSLLFTGTPFIAIAPWLVLLPGLVLTLIVIAINLLSDGLRHAIDPIEQQGIA
ncbi:ABC transporter permease [Devosia epidermidihirudinis]|nr:ABC transporter permease [Devosia epidermidihirudinis]